jgi:hypothetical protein
MVFIDLKKAYDKILQNVMWWVLAKHKVPAKYITLVKNMHNNIMTSVRTSDGDTDDFLIKIELSPYLFICWWMRSQGIYKEISYGVCSLLLLLLLLLLV